MNERIAQMMVLAGMGSMAAVAIAEPLHRAKPGVRIKREFHPASITKPKSTNLKRLLKMARS